MFDQFKKYRINFKSWSNKHNNHVIQYIWLFRFKNNRGLSIRSCRAKGSALGTGDRSLYVGRGEPFEVFPIIWNGDQYEVDDQLNPYAYQSIKDVESLIKEFI